MPAKEISLPLLKQNSKNFGLNVIFLGISILLFYLVVTIIESPLHYIIFLAIRSRNAIAVYFPYK